MKMTTEKAISILTQLVRFHFNLINEAPSRIEIEQAHYFIRTELIIAQRFESAFEIKSEPKSTQLYRISTLSAINPNRHTLYAVPKDKQ